MFIHTINIKRTEQEKAHSEMPIYLSFISFIITACVLTTPAFSQETTSPQAVCDPSLCDPNNPPKGNFCSMDPVIGCGLFCYDPIICSSLTVPIPITVPQAAENLLLSNLKPMVSHINSPATTKALPVQPATTKGAGPVIQLSPQDRKSVSITVGCTHRLSISNHPF